jgi:RNA polymerase sigma-70 factor (ECF subfamily)
VSEPGPGHEDFLRRFLSAQDGLRAACHACCGDPHLADDLFQETALAAWRGFAQYDGKRSFGAWLRGVLRHVHADHWRKRGNRQAVLPPAAVGALLEAAAPVIDDEPRDDRASALSRCLDRLGAGARTLLRLRYDDDLGREAIAEALGRSPAAVKKGLTRARSALLACMERVAGTPP